MAVKLDGKKLSNEICEKLKDEINELKKKGIFPKLAVVLVGNDPASQIYVRNKHRRAEKLGIQSLDLHLPETITEVELPEKVKDLNADSTVHGILVQLPLPKPIKPDKIINAISPFKDVDGFHP